MRTRCDDGIGAGGDGCADGFYGGDMGFDADPSHLATGVDPSVVAVVDARSFYTVPSAVLDVLENDTTLTRLDTGASVDLTATWASVITETEHNASLSLEPTSALTPGWYALTIAGSLDTMHGTPVRLHESAANEYQSWFRVGSAPLVIEIDNCSTDLTLRFSEPVDVPDVLPLAIQANGAELTCTRVTEGSAAPSPVSQLDLTCVGLDPLLDLEIAVTAGIVSPTAAALRDDNGDTTFTVSLPRVSDRCRYWRPTATPAF